MDKILIMLTITKMNTNDIPRVSELLCECYRWLGEQERFMPDVVAYLVEQRGSPELVRHESQTQVYLTARVDDLIVGMVSVKNNEIMKLYVAPEYHRRGIGRSLYETAEKIILESGHTQIKLGVLGKSPLPFYQAMGLTVSGQNLCKLGNTPNIEITLMEKTIVP